jgi:hypothetical protein
MKNKLFNKIILTLTFRRRLAAASIILIVLAYGLYKAMLSPYLSHFNSLRGELIAQKNLLHTKIGRAQALGKLQKECVECENNLEEVNKHYFTQTEAEEFMKRLPNIVSDFARTEQLAPNFIGGERSGSRVVVLKPKTRARELSRAEKLKKYVIDAHVPTEKDLVDFLDKHQAGIDAEEESFPLLKKALGMLPEKNREQFRNIWKQAQRSDAYSKLGLRKTDLEVTVQGRYQGLASLFEWFDKAEKLIEPNKLQVLVMREKAPEIEANFTLSIYVME